MWKFIGAAALLIAATLGGASPGHADSTSLNSAIDATRPTYFYPLTDPAGSSSAASFHGLRRSLTIAAVNDEGVSGSGLAFTGDETAFGGTQYLTGGPRPKSRHAFSVGAWFRVLPTEYAMTLLRAQDWHLDVAGPAGHTHLGWYSDNAAHGFLSSVDVGDDQLHQVVATGTSKQMMHLYIDGQLVGSQAISKITPERLSIASFPVEAGFNALHGEVSHVAAWRRELTAAEISTMYTAGIA